MAQVKELACTWELVLKFPAYLFACLPLPLVPNHLLSAALLGLGCSIEALQLFFVGGDIIVVNIKYTTGAYI
eukprot:scaffold14691_cov152-Skeletonema_dohrnii-CCMP3373.AAC.7